MDFVVCNFRNERKVLWPVFIADDTNGNMLFPMELCNLHHDHPHQGVEQKREDTNREHGATISQLVSNFSMKNEFYM